MTAPKKRGQKKPRAGDKRGQSRDTSYLVAWRQAFQAAPVPSFAFEDGKDKLSGVQTKMFIGVITHDVYTDCTFGRSQEELRAITGLSNSQLAVRVKAALASGWLSRHRGTKWGGKSTFEMLRGDAGGVVAFGYWPEESTSGIPDVDTGSQGPDFGSQHPVSGSQHPESRTANVKDITYGKGVRTPPSPVSNEKGTPTAVPAPKVAVTTSAQEETACIDCGKPQNAHLLNEGRCSPCRTRHAKHQEEKDRAENGPCLACEGNTATDWLCKGCAARVKSWLHHNPMTKRPDLIAGLQGADRREWLRALPGTHAEVEDAVEKATPKTPRVEHREPYVTKCWFDDCDKKPVPPGNYCLEHK